MRNNIMDLWNIVMAEAERLDDMDEMTEHQRAMEVERSKQITNIARAGAQLAEVSLEAGKLSTEYRAAHLPEMLEEKVK